MFGFPLLLIPLAICNIIIFLMPGVAFDARLFALPLLSGAQCAVSLSDALIAFALLLLVLEIQKSARVGGKYVTDHLLSLLIFGGAAAEFLLLPQFASATFFLLTLIALVDFLAGLGLRARRPRRVREMVVEPIAEAKVVREPPPVIVEPVVPQPSRLPGEHMTPAPPPPRVDPSPAPPRAEPAPRIEPIIDMDPVLGETLPPKPQN